MKYCPRVQPRRYSWEKAQVYHSCDMLCSTSVWMCPVVMFTVRWGAGVSLNPVEKLRPHLRNVVHPLLSSTLWFLLTHAFHALWLKKIAQPSKTFFEGGTLLIYLWVHLAWCPAHRSDSLSVYWLASFQFTRLYGLEIHSSALLLLSCP